MQQRLVARTRAVYIWLMAPLLGLAVFVGVFVSVAAPVATAATTSSNLNFQARLLTNTGAVVADGNYNIDFKLYNADSTTGSVGTCTGACLWEETRKNSNSQGVQVINGYFSVNLGSVTSFPTTINWDQQLWLTMNIGGTTTGASPTWDGEMQNSGHSIALTALPYSFVAGQLAKTSGANRGTLSFNTVANNPAIVLPDASGTVCLQGSGGANGCGYEGTSGNDFIQNQVASLQQANFRIQSAASNKIAAEINGASGQSVDLLDINNGTTVLSVGNNGQTLFKATASNDSQTFFQVQASGSATPIFDVDTQNGRVGIGGAPTNGTSTLQVIGAISTTNTTDSQKIVVNSNHGGAYGIDFYNDTASRVSYIHSTGSSSGGLAFCTNTTTSSCSLGQEQFILDASNSGAARFRVSTDSSSAFQVQDSSGSLVLGVDSATTGNLITNGSFENGTTGWAQRGTATLAQTAGYKYIGNDGLSVTTTAAANNGAEFGYSLASNTEYVLTLYARTAPGSSMSTFQIGYSLDGTNDTSCLTGQTVNTNWTQYTCTFDTATTSGSPYIYAKQTDATARTFYIDGVQLSQFGLLANPGGELALTGNWAAKGTATPSQDATQFTTGTHSIKALVAATGDGVKQNITLTNSTTYYLSFNIATTATAASTFEAGYSSDGSTDNTPCTSVSATIVTNGWTRVSCTFITPATHSGTPYFYIKQLDTNSPGFYLDAVRLTAGPPTLQYTEGRIALNGVLSAPVAIQNQADSTTAFQIQNSTGSQLLGFDSTTGSLNINHSSTSGTILTLTSTQAGDSSTYLKAVSSNGTTRASIDANGVITARAGTSSTVTIGSGNSPTVAFNTNATITSPSAGQIQVNGSGTVSTLIVQGQASQSADYFDLIPNGTSNPLFSVSNNGAVLSKNTSDSPTAFQVQNQSNVNIFNIDTSNGLVGTMATNVASTNTQDFNLRTGNATGTTSNSGSLKLDVGTATGTPGSILLGTVNNATAITIGSTSQSGIITLGQSASTNTITVGAAVGAGNTQTINVGNSGTGTTSINIGSSTASSTVAITAGNGISLNGNTTLSAGSNFTYASGAGNFNQSASTGTFATGSGNVSLNGATTVANNKSFTAGGSALFQDATNSATAFQVQNASATVSPLVVDTSSYAVQTQALSSSVGVLDNFNRANETILSGGGTWTTVNGALGGAQLLSNQAVQVSGGGSGQSFLNNVDTSGDSEVFATFISVGTGWVQLNLRYQDAGPSYYLARYDGTTTSIQKFVSGTTTSLNSTTGTTFSNGDVMTFRIVGTTLTILKNGTSVLSTTDSSISAAANDRIGIHLRASAATTSAIDNFGGGKLSTNQFSVQRDSTTTVAVSGAGASTFKNLYDSTAAFQVQNASGNKIFGVDTSGAQVVLGTAGTSGLNGKLIFSTTNASNTTITIQAASTATSYSLTLPTTGPALGQCLQNDGTTVGQLTFGACGASGTFLNKNSTDTSSAAGGAGYLYGFTSTGSSTGGVLSLNNSTNTGSTLNATTAGNPASGKAVIYGENTNATPTGNLIDLRSGSTPASKFSVDASGNILFGGTLAGNTFTGTTLTFSGASANSLQAASSQALNITGNASSLWQVGGTNQNLTIQTSGTGTLAIDTAGAGTVSLGAANAGTINIGSNNSTSVSVGGTSLVGTISNKVQGITTTLTGAASNSSYVVKSTSNSNGTFQVQNSGGNKVFSVDTTAGQTVLGQSSSVNGSLLFQNSSNSNGITLNSTGTSSSYTLTLPTGAPAGGLCIETSTGNASQLIFASCSNNNASIQQVNYWDANNTNSVTVSPTTIGDEMILTTQIPTSGVTVTNVSGGGVTTWNKVVANTGNGTVNRVELWVGTVTSTGSSSLTVTYSSSPGAEEVTASEFTAAGVNASTSWGIESSGSQLNSSASTTVTFPNATAVNGSELYYGYGQVQNPPAISGSTSGFSYQVTSTQHNIITYNTSLSANASYQPTATQTSSGQSNTVNVVLTAFVTSTSINNTTSLQKANFYVQAASAGTVAGVLQAASTGSADIFDIRNSGGTNTLTVGSSGDVLIKPAASATAFQVQNSSGYSVLGVDTSGSQVTLGDATHLSGKITFKDSGDTNTISILAPSSVAATYSLTLPTNTPTAGLCLGTSPSNANQLIFASCATQVSAASITYINQWSNSGTSITTLADSPAATGNLLVLFSHSTNAVSITGVSGGGVTNWTKVTSNTGGAGFGNDEMWRGVVTSTGSATITVTYSAAAGGNEITAQEYTMGGTGGGTWAIDTSGTTTGTNTTINYPSLTPASSSELYAGYAWGANTMSAGSTSGYTYVATNGSKYTARNTNVTGGIAQQPTASQSVSGAYNSIAALIQAFAGTSVIVNSTATQQANFNVQAALSGTVAGVLQAASSGTADALQVKDGSGNNVMTVNGASGSVTLGTSSAVAGTLIFNASGNTNTITITAPSTPGTSYSLKLPSAQAAPGQCLAASPSDNTQLVFSSCANQVTSVAISFVNNWKTSGSGVTTLSVSPANLNDMMIFFSSPRGAGSIASLSGGGVSTWSKITSTTAGSGADTSSIDMWKGVVTSTGSSTITATFSGSAGNPNELAAMEFTTGSTTGSWVVDASNAQYNSTGSTSVAFPSLTPQSSRDLYVGYAAGGANTSAGSTTGYTYLTGSLSNRIGLYNTSISAATSPTATQASAVSSLTVGALIAAYSSSSVISNSTVTQQANFNIQAATSGSVAGTLQAFSGGTGDILDILDGTGTLTDKFDYQGNLLVRPSTAGATAFQVQNTSNVNVLSVNTSSKQVVVGAGSAGETSPSLLVLDNQTGSSADPTEVNGAMYYNATTHTFRCGVAGVWQNCAGLLYANTSKSSANSNCSNNCAAFDTVASVPANYCQAGKVIRLSANGYFSSQATATNIQFGIYYGTDASVPANDVLIGSVSPAVSVTSANNNYFQINFDINCFSTTSMQAGGTLGIQTGAAASGMTSLPMNSTSAATVVTSSAKNIYIFPIWSAASASNTATLAQFGVNSP